jgi:hypothetical protein
MHRVGRDGLSFLDLQRYGIPDKSIVILSFGEIDVRCHLLKVRDKEGIDLETIIERLVRSYCQTLLENLKILPQTKLIVRSVVPPVEIPADLEYEFSPYGLLEDRVYVTKMLNQSLKQHALSYGFYYLDAYTDFCDMTGQMILEFNDGNVHLNEKAKPLLTNQFLTNQLMRLLEAISEDKRIYF